MYVCSCLCLHKCFYRSIFPQINELLAKILVILLSTYGIPVLDDSTLKFEQVQVRELGSNFKPPFAALVIGIGGEEVKQYQIELTLN